MIQHKCFTGDGMAIVCFCVHGQDHEEVDFDTPADAVEQS